MKKIALLGSTGSIGKQVLNVVRRNPEKFKIVSLAAGNNAGLFLSQVEEFRPKIATISTELNKDYIPPEGVKIYHGDKEAYLKAITEKADIVVVALVGFIGINAVLDAIEKGKDIALANKESLVVGGELIMRKAKEKGIKIFPIDSEHSAIWQALGFDTERPFKRIILTASGGAFRDFTPKMMERVTAKQALNHPNWNMGSKITVDCATMVNKAYEVAEARWLYNAPFNKIDVIIHRESIIHSMVEYQDGSTMAQMSYPNMELPIQIALSYPQRLSPAVESLDFAKLGELTFEELDHKKYPCFDVALSAIKKGGAYPAVLNGANDRAVKKFLSGEIAYKDIYTCISGAVQAYKGRGAVDLETLKKANAFGEEYVEKLFGL